MLSMGLVAPPSCRLLSYIITARDCLRLHPLVTSTSPEETHSLSTTGSDYFSSARLNYLDRWMHTWWEVIVGVTDLLDDANTIMNAASDRTFATRF
jgi:hypothetical protein